MEELKQFSLLMWKHYHLRKHRWFMTGVEIFLPIIIAYLLCAEGGQYLGHNSTHYNATINPVYDANHLAYRTMFQNLVFTPANKFTLKIVSKAFESLYFNNIAPSPTEAELEDFIIANTNLTRREIWMGVVFLNTNDTDLIPSKLNYKIRTVFSLHSDSLYYDEPEPGPCNEDRYAASGFAGLQTALDTAFIQLRNPNFNYNKKFFQPFPYPEYTSIERLRAFAPTLICYVVILTSLMTSAPLISNIIEEKESGVKELMKLAGMKEWVLQASWFLNAIVFNFISFSIVVYLLQRDFYGPQSAVLLNVPLSIVWACIIFYCIANITFCFTFAAIFHKLSVASSVFILTFCFLVYSVRKVNLMNSWLLIRFSCLCPLGVLYQGFQRIAFFENQGQPLYWSSLNTVEAGSEGISLQCAFIVLFFDTFLYVSLSYYINAINPGNFGTRKPPLFFLERWFVRLRSNIEFNQLSDCDDDSHQTKYFEKPHNDLEVSIKIMDLFKRFDCVTALRGVNLNVYKGEITALLGHNGAGKSTTMAILTGMIEPTAGSIVYKRNIDVLKQMKEFRKELGLCPQENRLFPYLSVINHLIFFGMLKGASRKDALKEARDYLRDVEMISEERNLTKFLSGGMKRKLCLAIALMGKAETLILDEPTSGMDVESRRKIWDLLLKIRGNRTIILTTHHMEEADCLGDRIAIMNNGSIVCHGTALFLKKLYGSGYEVTFSRNGIDSDAVEEIIKNTISTSEKKSESAHEIVYRLPLTETTKFPKLFHSLEEQKSQLGIENIGVSCTTMEQVFLKVGEISPDRKNTSSPAKYDVMSSGSLMYHLSKRPKTGARLIFQQLQAIMLKKCLFVERNFLKLFVRVLLPTFILMWILHDSGKDDKSEHLVNLTLSTYPDAKAFLTNDTTYQPSIFRHTVDYIEKNGGPILYTNNQLIVDGLLDYGRKYLDSFQKDLLVAASYNTSHNLTLYNKYAYHSLPILINMISNIELELLGEENVTINAINHPIKTEELLCPYEPTTVQHFFLFVAFAFYSIDLGYYFSIALTEERLDGFKHIQFISNLSPITYWISNFVFDFVFFFLIIILRVFSFKLIGDHEGFLAFQHPFEIFLLLVSCFIAAGLLFTYVLNFCSKSKEGSYVILLIINFVATIITIFFYYVQYQDFMEKGIFDKYYFPKPLFYFLKYLILLVPSLNYTMAFLKFFLAWYNNYAAQKPICRGLLPVQNYLEFASKNNVNGCLEEVIFLLIDILLYAVILIFIESGHLESLVEKLLVSSQMRGIDEDRTDETDFDVLQEREFVCSHSSPLLADSDIVMLARGLTKVFRKNRKPFVAVKDVYFTVGAGECFGLLGVNGAGKSTCFRMLTGDLLPTDGSSMIQNKWLRSHRSLVTYLSQAGYCAQGNSFVEDLTGREILIFIASLRGISSDEKEPVVDFWLSVLGLKRYQNEKCESYSGGNKRKLCTAMALIGNPVVVFLDEPTAGVDPVSRRKLYEVMEHSKASGQSVVLSSHSMEECENLCDHLTIMAKGRMRCIGTPQHLKLRFAQGFSIFIKTHETPNEETDINLLKENMHEVFGREYCNLKDEHKGLLYYQIKNVSLRWSQLFGNMENLKQSCAIIDDYTVTDTTLEEVFMSFAQQEEIMNASC